MRPKTCCVGGVGGWGRGGDGHRAVLTWSFSIRGELFTLTLGRWLALGGDFCRANGPKQPGE